jgi:hypothetical protein
MRLTLGDVAVATALALLLFAVDCSGCSPYHRPDFCAPRSVWEILVASSGHRNRDGSLGGDCRGRSENALTGRTDVATSRHVDDSTRCGI